ncbi:unnamed protein product [Miscanthus lutarioriparius]|uniref:Uncharacterized protein n=1 Tax=Miscanthus lutarioriparius TaxID=422564 RepID=A0A811RCI0_9POAL|nr:unnamed protein product [Miscanthus lutarioriparius]
MAAAPAVAVATTAEDEARLLRLEEQAEHGSGGTEYLCCLRSTNAPSCPSYPFPPDFQTTPPRRHNHRQTPSFSLDPTGRRRARRSPSPNPAAGSMAPRPSLREAGRARATADGGLRQQQLLRRRETRSRTKSGPDFFGWLNDLVSTFFVVPLFPLDKRKNTAEFQAVSAAKFVYGCAIDAAMWNPNCLFDSLQAGVMLPEKSRYKMDVCDLV